MLDKSTQAAYLFTIQLCRVPFCGRTRVKRRDFCAVHLRQKTKELREAKRKARGGVYFVRSEIGGPVKIGRADDFKARLSSLQTSHPDTLVIVATIPDRVDLEEKLHRALRQHRKRGEWFEWVPEVELVCALAKEGRIDVIERFVATAQIG